MSKYILKTEQKTIEIGIYYDLFFNAYTEESYFCYHGDRQQIII